MIEAGKVIFSALNGQITGLAVTPKQDSNQRPVAIYKVDALEPTRTKSGVHARNYTAAITVFADSYNQTQTIVGQIVDLLEAISGTQVAGYTVRYCTAGYSGDVYDEEIGYGADITINLTINE